MIHPEKSGRPNRIGRSPTAVIAEAAKEMLARGEDLIDLSVGEPAGPTPKNIRDAAIRAMEGGATKYTPTAGTVELREAVARKFRNENGLDYGVPQIIVSAGAKQCLFNAIHALVSEGDEVVIPAPYYASYPAIVRLARARPVFVEAGEKNGFKITPRQLREAISPRTKLVILCNPVNPTGAVYSRNDYEAITGLLEDGDFHVLADEVYEKFIYDDFRFVSLASLSEKIKRKTVVVNGPSKSYAMTGWRIGYAAGPTPVIEAMTVIQSHSTSNASSVSQAAAVEALTGPQDSVEIERSALELGRNDLYGAIVSLEGMTCVKPSGAFYLFPNVSAYLSRSMRGGAIRSSADLAMALLREAKVAVMPGSAFGAEGYLRLSYAVPLANLREAVLRIRAFAAGFG
jgi:aspartate aminotransferase